MFACRRGEIVRTAPARIVETARFLREAPRPISLTGEGLGYHDLAGEGITVLEKELWLPTAGGLWRVGRRMALAGQFSDQSALLPLYMRKPEAVRLWEARHTGDG